MTTVLEAYQRELQLRSYEPDPGQLAVVAALEERAAFERVGVGCW